VNLRSQRQQVPLKLEKINTYGFGSDKIGFDQSWSCFIQIGLSDSELTATAESERIQAIVTSQVDANVAATDCDLSHLAAHEIGHLARQILMTRAVVAELTVGARAERKHTSVL
jgi:hypothetical protein